MKVDQLASLRGAAAKDPKLAIKEVARQFEGLFMQELMKSMRQAGAALGSGALDNDGTKLGTELLDTELSGKLAGLKGGLADAIARQLERQMGLVSDAATRTRAAGQRALDAVRQAVPAGAPVRAPAHASEFVSMHNDAAERAERATGIPAAFMVAQAAHETGWGRRQILRADGSNSFNLFGIKAGPGWKGPVARITTTEYVDGQPRKVQQDFRAYASYEESFADYARLMKTSPRYRGIVAASADGAPREASAQEAQRFAQGLQRAGYATDPAYADKLGRVINTTLRLQRSLA